MLASKGFSISSSPDIIKFSGIVKPRLTELLFIQTAHQNNCYTRVHLGNTFLLAVLA